MATQRKVSAEVIYVDGIHKVGPPCDTEKEALAVAKKAEPEK
jgi:hypothetical protein